MVGMGRGKDEERAEGGLVTKAEVDNAGVGMMGEV